MSGNSAGVGCTLVVMNAAIDIAIDELVERYSAILFDAYGVLSYSVGALPGAAALIGRLNRLGKPYYVLTNDASALPETRARRYQSVGLAVAADRIITSGGLLRGYFAEHGLRGARCVVLGTADSAEYVRRAGGVVVDAGEAFDALVVGDQSGFPFIEGVNAVMSALFRKIDRGDMPRLLLPNPDLVYPDDSGFGMASGSVALILEAALRQRYPRMGGLEFERLGKPHGAMFAEAQRRSGTRDMVMIGDTPDTDIRGANAYGIASALMAGGVGRPGAGLEGADRPTYRIETLVSASLV